MSVNLYKPETRPRHSIQVLTCHEGRPGHNLQIPVAEELDSLPKFRRYAYCNAFGEGWALYSETLCDKPMGLYDKDPYSKFGYLNYQIWRAVRLVVDTDEDGWTREQAVKYMQDNTALADQNIATEVDRYIVWPGQALSYMIGEQTILSLRDEAKRGRSSATSTTSRISTTWCWARAACRWRCGREGSRQQVDRQHAGRKTRRPVAVRVQAAQPVGMSKWKRRAVIDGAVFTRAHPLVPWCCPASPPETDNPRCRGLSGCCLRILFQE